MTSDIQMYEDRRHIFKYYFKHKPNVTELCTLFNRSRTWFYKWKQRYELYCKEGLRNIDRSPPAMPNRTPLDIEMKIPDFIITCLSFKHLVHELAIKLTKVCHPWANGACERLNRTILEEFYQVAFRTKIYQSAQQLNDDLSNS